MHHRLEQKQYLIPISKVDQTEFISYNKMTQYQTYHGQKESSMGQINQRIFKTKCGNNVTIRTAFLDDAHALINLAKNVIDEEIFQLTSSKEFHLSIEDEEIWIETHRLNPHHLILVAEIDAVIVGVLDFSNGHKLRIAHTGDFGISIAKAFRSMGIGTLLIKELIDWATTNHFIEKINLSVHSTNNHAINLYKKLGFEIEGIKKNELKYGEGKYVDAVLMGKIL